MEKFKKGDIVWAKIRGYPWWPGVVAQLDDTYTDENDAKILVNFIGDNSHARLPLNKVSSFDKYFNEYSRSKKKDLLESIEVAQKIRNGAVTYEGSVKGIIFIEQLQSFGSGKKDKLRSVAPLKKKRLFKDREDTETVDELTDEDDEYSSQHQYKKKFKKNEHGSTTSVVATHAQGDAVSSTSSTNKKKKRGRPPRLIASKRMEMGEDEEVDEESAEDETQQQAQGSLRSMDADYHRRLKMRQMSSNYTSKTYGKSLETVRALMEKLRVKTEFKNADSYISELIKSGSGQVLEDFEKLQSLLLSLYRTDITINILQESKIGKSLSRFYEFCTQESTLDKVVKMVENILNKWRNYVNNTLFETNFDQPGLFHSQSLPLFTPKSLLNKAIMDLQLKKKESDSGNVASIYDDKKSSAFSKVIRAVEEKYNNEHEINQKMLDESNVKGESSNKYINGDRQISIEITVTDISLRKNVCKELAKLLEEKSIFEKEEARNMALRLEEQLRIIDPSMKEIYKEHFLALAKELKTLQGNSIKDFINKKIDIIANV